MLTIHTNLKKIVLLKNFLIYCVACASRVFLATVGGINIARIFDKILGPVFGEILALDVYRDVTRTFSEASGPFSHTIFEVFRGSRRETLLEKKFENR